MQGKPAVEGEAIERAAMGYVLSGQVVFSLIEEGAGFLTGERSDDEAHAVLIDFDLAIGIQSAVAAALCRRTPN